MKRSNCPLEYQLLNYLTEAHGVVWRLREGAQVTFKSGATVENPAWTQMLRGLETQGLVKKRLLRRTHLMSDFYKGQSQVITYRTTLKGRELLEEIRARSQS